MRVNSGGNPGFVIPAKAGIHVHYTIALDSRLRGNDRERHGMME
jgi:hypothetical protein